MVIIFFLPIYPLPVTTLFDSAKLKKKDLVSRMIIFK